MSLENKIVDIQDNLILKSDGSVFAIYEVDPQVVNKVGFNEKEKLKSAIESMLVNIKEYGDFDIAMLPYPKDLMKSYQSLVDSFAKDTEDMAWSVLEKSYHYLMSQKELCDYKYFMSVPLKSIRISPNIQEVVKNSIEELSTVFVETIGLEKYVYEGWEKRYLASRKDLEKNLGVLACRRLESHETKFVNRYFYVRSLDVNMDNEINMIENNIENLGDKNIDFKHVNILKLDNDESFQYVAQLPVAYKPENVSYLHLIEEARNIGFPVEVFTKAKFGKVKGLPFNNLRTKARFARGRLKGAQEESYEADSVSKKSVSQSKFLVENMEKKIDEGIPMITYLQTLTVFDNDLNVLKEKINILMEKMKDLKVRLSRATPHQLYLFEKNRFGEVLEATDKNFLQVEEVGAFSENLFFMNEKVGQDVGFYIGMIDSQIESWHSRFREAISASDKPVFCNLYQGNEDADGKDSNNPHIQVSGDTGTGKTFLVSYLHFYCSLLSSQTLYIDPKREKRYWYQKMLKELEEENIYPELQNYIRNLHFVTLDHGDKKNHGVLDPLVFLDTSQAKDLIVSMINEFMPLGNEKKFKTALLKGIQEYSHRRLNGEQVGTLSILKSLQEHESEKVRETADLLVEEVTDSVLSLVFSEGENPAVDLTARNTILEIGGLDLPTEENVSLSDQNKKSLAIMYALGRFCVQFGEQDYAVKTLITMDEAWVLKLTAYGRGLIDRIKRVGRSQNNFLIFVSQEVDDSNNGENEATAFGSYFCFYNDSENAAKKVLRRLKVEISEKSINWYNNMTKAQCLYRDNYGRVERITVDGYIPAVNKMFETVRKKEVA